MEPEEQTAFSEQEREMVKKIADRDGITEDEAATKLFSKALARRVRRKSGKGPGRVYSIKRK